MSCESSSDEKLRALHCRVLEIIRSEFGKSFLECFPVEVGISFLERFDACLDDGESFLLLHCSFLSFFLSFFLCFFLGACASCSVLMISARTACILSYFGDFVKFSVQTFCGGEWWLSWPAGGCKIDFVCSGWWVEGCSSKTPQNTPEPVKTIQNSVGVSPLLFF